MIITVNFAEQHFQHFVKILLLVLVVTGRQRKKK